MDGGGFPVAEGSGEGWRSEGGEVPVRDGARGAAVAGSRCRTERGGRERSPGAQGQRGWREGWMWSDAGARGPGPARPLPGPGAGRTDRTGSGRSRASRGRNLVRGRGCGVTALEPPRSSLRAPSLPGAAVPRPLAPGDGVLLADGREMTLE